MFRTQKGTVAAPAETSNAVELPGVAVVSWDARLETVVVEWEGWANSAELMTLLEAEVSCLQSHGASRLLIDCRRQRPLLPADLERADRDWLPRAVAAGLARFAVVLPTSEAAAIDLRNREASFRRSALQVQFFAGIGEAKRWLVAPAG